MVYFIINNPLYEEKCKIFLTRLLLRCNFTHKTYYIENEITKVCNNLLKSSKKDHVVHYEPEFKLGCLKLGHNGYVLCHEDTFNTRNFNPKWNVRDILLSEGVIEIEHKTDLNLNWIGTLETICNLQKQGFHFAVFFAKGMRTPHIHLYDLFPDVTDWAEKEICMTIFCRRFVPFEYFHLVDKNLWSEHKIALEFAPHYRTGYPLELLGEFIPEVNT